MNKREISVGIDWQVWGGINKRERKKKCYAIETDNR